MVSTEIPVDSATLPMERRSFAAFPAFLIMAWFSRAREFRADAAGAQLAGREKMIAALERLKRAQDLPSSMPDTLMAFGIRRGMAGGMRAMFASHPPLDARIAALRAMDA